MDAPVKYITIAQDLTQKIHHGQYAAGKLLPSEATLQKLYGTSRATIRKALDLLNDNGLIQKIKGKGSMVLDTARFTFPISGITSFRELNKSQHMHAQTKVLTMDLRPMPRDVISQLNLTNPESTYLSRVRIVDGDPVVLDQDYILTSVVPHITRQIAETSIYQYFEQNLHLEIGYATKTITVEPVNNKVCAALNLPKDSLAVAVRSLTYLKDTTFFQYTISLHRPDRFKFVDFARRTPTINFGG